MKPTSLFLLLALTACVPKAKYDLALDQSALLTDQLSATDAEFTNARLHIAQLEQELVGLTERAAALSAMSEEANTRNDELNERLAQLEEKLAALGARGKQDQAQKAELEAMLAAMRQQASQAKDQAATARTRLDEMAAEQEKLTAERERLMAEAERLRAEKDRLEQKTAAYDELVGSLKAEIDAGQVTITELSGKLTLNLSNAILFASGSYELKAEGTAALGKVADVLAKVQDREIRVEGHTDNVPVNKGASFADNWALSSLRASTVVSLLVAGGVNGANIAAMGYGEHHPLASNETPEGRAANRRTEIVLVPRLKQVEVAPPPAVVEPAG